MNYIQFIVFNSSLRSLLKELFPSQHTCSFLVESHHFTWLASIFDATIFFCDNKQEGLHCSPVLCRGGERADVGAFSSVLCSGLSAVFHTLAACE